MLESHAQDESIPRRVHTRRLLADCHMHSARVSASRTSQLLHLHTQLEHALAHALSDRLPRSATHLAAACLAATQYQSSLQHVPVALQLRLVDRRAQELRALAAATCYRALYAPKCAINDS